MNIIITYYEFVSMGNRWCSHPSIESFEGGYKEFEEEYKFDNITEYLDLNKCNNYYEIANIIFIDTSKNYPENRDIVVPKLREGLTYSEIRDKYLRYIHRIYFNDRFISYDGYSSPLFAIEECSENGGDCYRFSESDKDPNIKYYELGQIVTYMDEYEEKSGIIVLRNCDFDYISTGKNVNRIYEIMPIYSNINSETYIHHDDIKKADKIDLDMLKIRVHDSSYPFNPDYIQFIDNYIASRKEG